MSVTLRTNLGSTEAVLADDGTLNLFYQIADIVSRDLKVRFLRKEDDVDSVNWDFRYKGQNFILHYSIYNGISILPAASRDAERNNKVLTEMAVVVGSRLDNTPAISKRA